MPARVFSPKQRRLIFALLQKKGLLKKFAASKPVRPGLSPSAWIPRSTVSGRHVADFKSLLEKGDKPRIALDKIRAGGMLPKLSATGEKRLGSVMRSRGAPSKSVFVNGIMDPELDSLLNRHSPGVRANVDKMFESWFSTSSIEPAAYRLRQLARDVLGPTPGSRFMRPEVLAEMRDPRRRALQAIRQGASLNQVSVGRILPEKYRFTQAEKDYLLDLYAHNQKSLSSKRGEFITMYRGVSREQAQKIKRSLEDTGVAAMDTDTLSSWTEDRNLPQIFLRFNSEALIVRVKVHRSRSLAFHRYLWQEPTNEHIIFGDRFWLTPDDIVMGLKKSSS